MTRGRDPVQTRSNPSGAGLTAMEGGAQPHLQAAARAGQDMKEGLWQVWLVLESGVEYWLLEINFEEGKMRVYSAEVVDIVDDSEVDEKIYVVDNRTFKVSEPEEVKHISILKNCRIVGGEAFDYPW